MRLGVNLRIHQDFLSDRGKMVAAFRSAERIGFDSIWFFDAIGRGRFHMDPLIGVSVAAAVTERVEVGTCILQVPLRHPVELAHRLLSAQFMADGRLQLGVGAGSTRGDFEAVGQDYETRFRALREALPMMRRLWNGETVNGVNLSPPPAAKGGPPILIGSWAGSRWIPIAAQDYDGWIASCVYTGAPTLKAGVERFRAAGGKRAIATNIGVDLTAPASPLSDDGPYDLRCPPDEARVRLERLAEMGFDDAVLVIEEGSEENLRAVRALWPR
jgi:alkanesulfonate monooxygenase SsuD/methylene tetrahydromethanopterin reductase-like flavin-dependent oxidoreductase (luciferase family)